MYGWYGGWNIKYLYLSFCSNSLTSSGMFWFCESSFGKLPFFLFLSTSPNFYSPAGLLRNLRQRMCDLTTKMMTTNLKIRSKSQKCTQYHSDLLILSFTIVMLPIPYNYKEICFNGNTYTVLLLGVQDTNTRKNLWNKDRSKNHGRNLLFQTFCHRSSMGISSGLVAVTLMALISSSAT